MQVSHSGVIVHAINWKSVRVELRAKREELFESFLKNPADIRLAKEIRLLDEQLLKCSEHMERERKPRLSRRVLSKQKNFTEPLPDPGAPDGISGLRRQQGGHAWDF
jgi:hypothetical protein